MKVKLKFKSAKNDALLPEDTRKRRLSNIDQMIKDMNSNVDKAIRNLEKFKAKVNKRAPTYKKALVEGTARLMSDDDNLFVMGEDEARHIAAATNSLTTL